MLFLKARTIYLSEQIVSADKHPSIFSCVMEANVYTLGWKRYIHAFFVPFVAQKVADRSITILNVLSD